MQTLKKRPPGLTSLAKRSGFWGQNLRKFHPKPSQSDLGRFISADPIGFAGGLNHYAYGSNNPVRFVDPSGEYAEVIVGLPDPTTGVVDVTITLPIEFTGAGATDDTILKFTQEIQNAWTKKFGKYNVKTIVTTPSKDCPTKKKNTILVYPKNLSGRSHSGTYDGNWYSDRAGRRSTPAPHEAGHLMGLPDTYVEGTFLPLKGFERNVMSKSPHMEVTESQIEEIIRYNR